MSEIKIMEPGIFPGEEIIAGFTLSDYEGFPPDGFSIMPTRFDSEPIYLENANQLALQIGLPADRLQFQLQTHGKEVREITATGRPREHDGMTTNKPGIALCSTVADCAAILLFDPVNKAIASIHSGWKGTKQNILGEGIRRMAERYGSRPGDLLAYVSPAACGEDYEVGEDVASLFPESTKPLGGGKYLFDNRAEILRQALAAGMVRENMEISDECTISDKRFHSFRRDGELSGRMVAFIALRPEPIDVH